MRGGGGRGEIGEATAREGIVYRGLGTYYEVKEADLCIPQPNAGRRGGVH